VLDYLMRADSGQIRAGVPGAVAGIQAATPGAEERQ